MELNYDTIVDRLCSEFPELSDEIDELIKWAGHGKHLVFGQVFKPYIRKCFLCAGTDEDKKQKIALFMEHMAESSDDEVRALLTDTVLEELLDYPKEFELIEPYFLPEIALLLPAIKNFGMMSGR